MKTLCIFLALAVVCGLAHLTVANVLIFGSGTMLFWLRLVYASLRQPALCRIAAGKK